MRHVRPARVGARGAGHYARGHAQVHRRPHGAGARCVGRGRLLRPPLRLRVAQGRQSQGADVGKVGRNAVDPSIDLEEVTVTLAIHPFHGRRFPVLRVDRDVQGAQGSGYLVLGLPEGGVLRLPAAWTDRAEPGSLPRMRPTRYLVSVVELRQLAALVEAKQRESPCAHAAGSAHPCHEKMAEQSRPRGSKSAASRPTDAPHPRGTARRCPHPRNDCSASAGGGRSRGGRT